MFNILAKILGIKPVPVTKWFLFFNADFVGMYWGDDYSNMMLDFFIDAYPGDCEPIQIVEAFDVTEFF